MNTKELNMRMEIEKLIEAHDFQKCDKICGCDPCIEILDKKFELRAYLEQVNNALNSMTISKKDLRAYQNYQKKLGKTGAKI